MVSSSDSTKTTTVPVAMPVAIVVVLKTQEILTAMAQAPTISAMVVIALAAMTQALRVARIATFQW